MNKAIVKSKSPYKRAVAAIVSFVIGVGLLVGGAVVAVKAGDSLDKYMATSEYKTTITAELNEINNDYVAGKIDAMERDMRTEVAKDMTHTRELLKKSEQHSELQADVAKHDVAGVVMMAVAGVGIVGGIAAGASAENLANKKKYEDDEALEENK